MASRSFSHKPPPVRTLGPPRARRPLANAPPAPSERTGVPSLDDPVEVADRFGHHLSRISISRARGSPQEPAAGAVVQRVVIQDSASGELHDTDDMTPQDRKALALRFHFLHHLSGLEQLRQAHPEEDFSDSMLLQISSPVERSDPRTAPQEEEEETSTRTESSEEESHPRKRPRTRKEHDLSEGESESEDPNIVFRALRKEEDPFESGLLPPEGHDPSITATAHSTAGTRAKKKSPWVSLTRSRKVASAWASESSKEGGRVAKVRIPEELRAQEGTVFDLTDPEQAKKVFPTLKGSSYNSAKASQEVLVKGGLGKEHVVDMFKARKLPVKEYEKLKQEKEKHPEIYAMARTRTKTTGKPLPRILERMEPKKEPKKRKRTKDEKES
jgi:hypothetical protein